MIKYAIRRMIFVLPTLWAVVTFVFFVIRLVPGGPAVAVLDAARRLGADGIRILHHCNSGDVTGNRDAVVGYLAAAALRTH